MAPAGLESIFVTDEVAMEIRQTAETQTASDTTGDAISAELDWLTADVRESNLSMARRSLSGG